MCHTLHTLSSYAKQLTHSLVLICLEILLGACCVQFVVTLISELCYNQPVERLHAVWVFNTKICQMRPELYQKAPQKPKNGVQLVALSLSDHLSGHSHLLYTWLVGCLAYHVVTASSVSCTVTGFNQSLVTGTASASTTYVIMIYRLPRRRGRQGT